MIEAQFPTEASRVLGKRTNELYEIIRLDSADPKAWVESFLEILSLNKQFGISDRMPPMLDWLPAPIDTSMARWVDKNSGAWDLYQETLETEWRTCSEVVEERGLVPSDFPRAEGWN